MVTKPFSAQIKPLVVALLTAYLPGAFLLLLIVLVGYINKVPVARLVCDPNAIASKPFYTGAISNIGIMLWCATISICFFTSAVLRMRAAESKTVYFLVSAGGFTLMLMLDDAFLFHEIVFPTYFGLSNHVVYILYAIAAVIIFFKEDNPCGLLCTDNHPFSKVERFGHWFYSRGQDRKAGIHSSEMKWRLFTKEKALALQTAEAHIE